MDNVTRLAGADGVRGFACLMVLGVHTSMIVYPSTASYLAGCGKIGVWLFFVLSAFLLTRQLISRGFDAATLADYAMGRVLRILPAFAVAVLVYKALGTADIDSWTDVARALSMGQGYAHLWTISVEFKTYAVIPLFSAGAAVISRRFGAQGVLAATSIAIAVHQYFFPFTALEESSPDAIWYAPSFLLGCATAACLSDWRAVSARANACITIAVLIAVITITPAFRSVTLGIPPTPYLMNKYLFFSAAWAFFILAVVSGKNSLSRIFSSRTFSAIGGAAFRSISRIGTSFKRSQSFARSTWIRPFRLWSSLFSPVRSVTRWSSVLANFCDDLFESVSSRKNERQRLPGLRVVRNLNYPEWTLCDGDWLASCSPQRAAD